MYSVMLAEAWYAALWDFLMWNSTLKKPTFDIADGKEGDTTLNMMLKDILIVSF